jgi:hypothetical protein
LTTSSAEFHTETRLRALIARGFRFLHPRDAHGETLAVVGVRVHHDVVDVVHLAAEDAVVAMRMPSCETDLLAPSRTWWRSAGSVCEVLDELLRLPDDRTPAAAGHLVHTTGRSSGCWVPGAAGRARWLAADG